MRSTEVFVKYMKISVIEYKPGVLSFFKQAFVNDIYLADTETNGIDRLQTALSKKPFSFQELLKKNQSTA